MTYSASSGDQTINAEGLSLSQIIDVFECLRVLDHSQRRRRTLRLIDHGHVFGDDRQCRCGTYEREYRYECHSRSRSRLCRSLSEKI